MSGQSGLQKRVFETKVGRVINATENNLTHTLHVGQAAKQIPRLSL